MNDETQEYNSMREVGNPSTNMKEKLLKVVYLGWFFEKWYEKLIIFAALVALVYSIMRIWMQGFW